MATIALPAPHAHEAMTDLVQSATPEPRDAACDLLVREESALRRIIARYVRHATVVDDLFQEVSLKVMRRIDTVRDPQAVRGWLFQLARNACLDWIRAQDRRPTVPGEHLEAHDAGGELGRNPSDNLIAQERIAAVRRALAQLPESQREVIRLRVDEGLDHEGIAAHLGISRQAVEVRLCRGRARLKEQLENILQGDL